MCPSSGRPPRAGSCAPPIQLSHPPLPACAARRPQILLNLLPNIFLDVDQANSKWRALAAKHGFEWSTCGDNINPNDKDQLYDGIHPQNDGYKRLFRCLQPQVGWAGWGHEGQMQGRGRGREGRGRSRWLPGGHPPSTGDRPAPARRTAGGGCNEAGPVCTPRIDS